MLFIVSPPTPSRPASPAAALQPPGSPEGSSPAPCLLRPSPPHHSPVPWGYFTPLVIPPPLTELGFSGPGWISPAIPRSDRDGRERVGPWARPQNYSRQHKEGGCQIYSSRKWKETKDYAPGPSSWTPRRPIYRSIPLGRTWAFFFHPAERQSSGD